ncbi:MAG: DedA family protein [Anaerolinea sp.]|nr:DedA family protein [Anaerolinea sp.]
MNERRREIIKRLLLFLPVIAITVGVFLIRDQLKQLEGYGYPGIFLLSILANATLIIPVPGVVITSTMATVFNPLGVALAAGLGAALGELTGYMAGYSGQIVVEGRERYLRLVEWMKKYGGWTILFLAFIPNPAFDMAGIVAGGLKMPVAKFLMWCAIGKILKMLVFAYAGSSIFNWLGSIFSR